MEDKKWKLGVSLDVRDEEVLPEFRIKNKPTDNSEITLTVSKDKISANYELEF